MEIEAAEALKFLHARAPQLTIRSLLPVSRGDFTTFEADNGWIFRFPRDAATAAKLEREAAILPELAPVLPVAISAPECWLPAAGSFPWPVAGYRRIDGVTGEDLRPLPDSWPHVAAAVAGVFNGMHSFPEGRARALGVTVRPDPDLDKMLSTVSSYAGIIREAAIDACVRPVNVYLEGAVDMPADALPPVLCHADLKGEHFIVDSTGRELQGIVDWSDLCITDPSIDFAYTFMWLGEEFVRTVIDLYECDHPEALLDRSAFLARCHTLIGLGRQLSGESYGPLTLLKTQIKWAFREQA